MCLVLCFRVPDWLKEQYLLFRKCVVNVKCTPLTCFALLIRSEKLVRNLQSGIAQLQDLVRWISRSAWPAGVAFSVLLADPAYHSSAESISEKSWRRNNFRWGSARIRRIVRRVGSAPGRADRTAPGAADHRAAAFL